jgi:predicted Fe-Mo cluster-binding NifX family protein
MRFALSTDGAFVSAHFGRCPTFTLVDIENGKVVKKTEVSNPGINRGRYQNFFIKKVSIASLQEAWECVQLRFLKNMALRLSWG